MSFRKEREKASAAAAGEAAPRIKFDDAPQQGDPAADLAGTKSPRGGSGRSALRSSGGASSGGGGGVVFKLNLPGATSSSSSSSSSSTPSFSNASPSSSSSSSSSKSAFTPRSMLNKVKHTLSLASDDMTAAASPGDADEPTATAKEKKRGSSSRHKRSRSMGDAKATAAAAVVPRDADAGHHHQQQAAAAGSAGGTHKSGSSVMRRKGSTASAHAGGGGGSFLSFSSSSTKLLRHDAAAVAADSIERSASDAAVMTTAATGLSGEAGDDANELDAQPGEGGAEGKEGETSAGAGGGSGSGQRRKWGSLQRRNNSLVIKKSSTADNIATQLAGGASSPSGKRNTIISEANGNRMDRTQRRRYRILVSSPRGGGGAASASGGGAEEGGEGELDPDADALGDDFDSDSDDSAEESIHTSEERKRSHTLAAGAKGLLKTPRFFHKDTRDKRALPQGESDPGFSFRPSLDEGRHRRTNSTDISFLEPGSEDVHLQTVHLRYKEMEDLQLGGKERRERTKRLSVHVDQVLAHRPSYDSLVHRGILKEWSEPSAKSLQDFPAHLPPLVWSAANNTAGKIDGWNVERGTTQDLVFGAHSALEDEGYVPFYETHFYKSEYTTWWGVDGEFGPIIICIHKQPVTAGEAEGEAQNCSTADPSLFTTSDSGVPTTSSSSHSGPSGILRRLGEKATGGKPAGGLLSLYRVLIQSKKGGKQLFIRSTEKSAEKLKALKTALGSQGYLTGEVASFTDVKFKKLKDLDIREDLLYLEKKFFSTDYKFGVLYVKNGQNENQMFSNLATDASPEFEKFLALMGEKITLKGFKGYTGGLDIKADTTGVESVYTEFRNQRIMYHVSTLLPFYPRDEQQVERKRHLGNDIVVIVFVEPGAQFDPTPMKTQFNHIYCVVCAEKPPVAAAVGDEAKAEEGATRVRIEFAVKQGVRPFGPPLPDPSETHFQLDTNLREFLLSKLVNSERAALKAPAFASKMEKTRKIFIEQLIDTKIHKK